MPQPLRDWRKFLNPLTPIAALTMAQRGRTGDGTDYWLADGFHRTAAAEAFGATDIDADIRQGTQRDAVLFSVSANSAHGQRRTNEDKRRAVLRLLNDPEWSGWSDSEIARRCGVDYKTVAAHRPVRAPILGNSQDTRLVTRGGTTYPMKLPGRPVVLPQPPQTNDTTITPLPEQPVALPDPSADLFTCPSCDEQFPIEVWHCETLRPPAPAVSGEIPQIAPTRSGCYPQSDGG